MSNTKYIQSPDFEIIVGDPSGRILNGDVPVRWCISPALVSALEQEEVKDPCVLILSMKGSKEMTRQLVPISELKTFVRFYKSGSCKLHAWLVFDNNLTRNQLKHSLTGFEFEHPISELISYDGTPHTSWKQCIAFTTAKVSIPKGVFGKEPAPWLKAYVNYWHTSTKNADECEYRRRFILAFTLKWIAVLFYVIVVTTTRVLTSSILILSGLDKCTTWSKSWQMFKYPGMMNYVDMYAGNNRFIIDYKMVSTGKRTITMQFLSLLAISPISLLVGTLAGYMLVQGEATLATLVVTLLMVLSIVFMLLLVADLFLLLLTLATQHNVLSKLDTNVRYRFILGIFLAMIGLIISMNNIPMLHMIVLFGVILIITALTSIVWYYVNMKFVDYTEIRELLCPENMNNVKQYIPPSQRTLRLWYLETKQKMCKPMQR